MARRPGGFTRSLLTVLAAAFLGVSTLSAEVPDWIETEYSRGTGTPTWVSADRAVIDGELQWELFGPAAQEVLEMMIEAARKAPEKDPDASPDGRCRAYISWPDTAAERGWTSETVFNRASAVYVGSVVDVEQGFLHGKPGTLIELEVEEALKGTDQTGTSIFIYYPAARIVLRDSYLCSEVPRGAFNPRLGGTLIYARGRERQLAYRELPLYVAEDPELYFETAGGGFSTPHGLDDVATSVSSFATELRLEAHRGGTP